jgi:hypothetical protein
MVINFNNTLLIERRIFASGGFGEMVKVVNREMKKKRNGN